MDVRPEIIPPTTASPAAGVGEDRGSSPPRHRPAFTPFACVWEFRGFEKTAGMAAFQLQTAKSSCPSRSNRAAFRRVGVCNSRRCVVHALMAMANARVLGQHRRTPLSTVRPTVGGQAGEDPTGSSFIERHNLFWHVRVHGLKGHGGGRRGIAVLLVARTAKEVCRDT